MFYDLSDLKKVKWENGDGVEDLIIYGIAPVKTLTDIIDEMTTNYNQFDGDSIRQLNLLSRIMLENMEDCIYRLLEQRREDSIKTAVQSSENIVKKKNIMAWISDKKIICVDCYDLNREIYPKAKPLTENDIPEGDFVNCGECDKRIQ